MYNTEILIDFYNDENLIVEANKVNYQDGNFQYNRVSIEDVDNGTTITFKGVESQLDLKMKCLNSLYHQRKMFRWHDKKRIL